MSSRATADGTVDPCRFHHNQVFTGKQLAFHRDLAAGIIWLETEDGIAVEKNLAPTEIAHGPELDVACRKRAEFEDALELSVSGGMAVAPSPHPFGLLS